MTLRGLLVLVLELLLAVLALGTEFKNFLLIVICIAGLMLYSLVSLILASLSLVVKTSMDTDTAQRKEKINYRFVIKGITLLPVASYFFVKTTDAKFSKRRKYRHACMLLPSFSVKREFVFEMPCAHVGEWEIGIKKIRVEDLFGFFSLPIIWCKRKELMRKIKVLPNIHDFGEVEPRQSMGGQGSSNLQNSENGEVLGDSRLYREGDTFRRINWKLSTRTKKLHSRLYDTPQEPAVTIVMDTAVCGEAVDDIIDISCETVLSLAKHFLEQGSLTRVIFTRCKDNIYTRTFDLAELGDLFRIETEFTNTLFGKQTVSLEASDFEGNQVLAANRLYVVSCNPSDELIARLTDMDKMGRVASCIVPCAHFEQADTLFAQKAQDSVQLHITSADHISERVGEVL